MTIRKDGRLIVSPLGEFYGDLLKVDAWINAKTIASQANSLLCAKLMQRQTEISNRVNYLATKRGISAEDLWSQILSGEAERESLPSENEIETDKNDISTNDND